MIGLQSEEGFMTSPILAVLLICSPIPAVPTENFIQHLSNLDFALLNEGEIIILIGLNYRKCSNKSPGVYFLNQVMRQASI